METVTDKITRVELNVLDYHEIKNCLQNALQKNFQRTQVEVLQTHPDLTQEPWGLASPGFSGSCIIADIGGPNNLNYHENHHITFNTQDIITQICKIQHPFYFGPGAANAKVVGFNAELMANDNLHSKSRSKYSYVESISGKYVQADYANTEIGVLANFLISEGKQGQVLKIHCSQRTGKLNFVSCIKKALDETFPDKTIGMGGVFLIKKGKIRAHVMPDFPTCDLLSPAESDSWLKFYEMGAKEASPLVCLSVLVSNDKHKLDLRQEHTHFYSAHGDGGHYHYDTTPDEVEYEGYFVLSESLYRVSIPTHSKDRTQFFKS